MKKIAKQIGKVRSLLFSPAMSVRGHIPQDQPPNYTANSYVCAAGTSRGYAVEVKINLGGPSASEFGTAQLVCANKNRFASSLPAIIPKLLPKPSSMHYVAARYFDSQTLPTCAHPTEDLQSPPEHLLLRWSSFDQARGGVKKKALLVPFRASLGVAARDLANASALSQGSA